MRRRSTRMVVLGALAIVFGAVVLLTTGCAASRTETPHGSVGWNPRSVVLAGRVSPSPEQDFCRNNGNLGHIGPAYAAPEPLVIRRISDRQFTTHGRPHDHFSDRTLIIDFRPPAPIR